MTQASRNMGYRFLEALGERPFPPAAIECASAAFALYENAWDCHSHHIAGWKWPFEEIKSGGAFEGDEPWAVLFRHAIKLLRERVTAGA